MVIGLTGGMGCGKSTAAGFFAEAGFLTEDTDRIVHELLAEDSGVIESVRGRFGDAVIRNEGGVDRGALGKAVFADRAGLEWLERLLHPRVAEYWRRSVESSPNRDWVVQIPLLFEKSLEKSVDFSVCVGADEETRHKRLLQRGLTGPEIAKRLSNQLPLTEKMNRAGYFLLNNGSLDFLRSQVRCLANRLTANSSFNF